MTAAHSIAPKYKTISDSQLHVWRVLIALVHADGVVHEKEKNWLSQCLKRLNISEDQKAILMNDYKIPQDYKILCNAITEKRDYVNLLHLANVLVHVDGHVDGKEKEFLENIRKAYTGPSTSASKEFARAMVQMDRPSSYWSSWDPNDWDHNNNRTWRWWMLRRSGFGMGLGLYVFGGILFRYPKFALLLFLIWLVLILKYYPAEKLSHVHFSLPNQRAPSQTPEEYNKKYLGE